jgi:hypothetical protein
MLVTMGTRTGLLLKTALLFTPGVVVTNVPYLQSPDQSVLDGGRAQRHVVVVLAAAAHNATLQALEYAKTLDADEIHAVHVELDPAVTETHLREWDAVHTGVPLEIVSAPYRRLGATLRDYVRPIARDPDAIVTIVLAEFVVRKWWHHILHNQNALDVKWTFLREPDVIVTSVPYRLEK